MGYHELYLGDAPAGVTYDSPLLGVTPCGKRCYIMCERFEISKRPLVYEFDLTTDQVTEFRIDIDDNDKSQMIIGFYVLRSGSHAVVLTYDTENRVTVQHRVLIDRSNRRMEAMLSRRMEFRTVGVSACGVKSMSGYIALAGKKVHDDDTVYMAQLVASDPHDAASFPDICLDQAFAELESLLRMRGLVPQIFYPMMNRQGVYFLTIRFEEHDTTYDFGVVGAIVYNHITRAFEARLIETHSTIEAIAGVNKNAFDSRDLYTLAQAADVCYLSAFIPAARTHWRWKLQSIGNAVSRFIITVGMRLAGVFNRPSFVYAYTRFYLWLFPNVVPNWKPAPQHRLLAVNMRSWNVASVRFEPHERTADWHGTLEFEATSHGDVVVVERPRRTSLLRIGYIQNPFEPPSLVRAATRQTQFRNWSKSKRSALALPSWNDVLLSIFEAIVLK
ncbi:hypothetical protein AAVH_06117 [Aphelenchoides avenae]|nr:hypothetical protein AAVH_06117 [Aphelenchus avenae]